ncbi:MAG: GTPase HflX [Gemmatimonadota bacterium]|nr:GTPase HflX [Gemmatimonadota bacterium]
MGAPVKAAGARVALVEHLEELARLADTAGADIVGEVTQLMDRPNPKTLLGKGKLEELRLRIDETQATLVIFDDELSPAQGRNIEQTINTRVMDRAELILDIFATRARTSEAKMQVELAQLEYTLPRLTRMWTHLEKTRGGIGMRGPGETQLETDRRLIGHRIKLLKERLTDVVRAREVQRQSRQAEFKASLVGYTNAGKSSILRSLADAKDIFVEDLLFATLDPLTREVDLGERHRVLVTDTVGFIRKLPHDLVASFRATLAEVRDSDLLLHVIDAASPMWRDHLAVVDDVLREIGVVGKEVLHVFNQIDRLDDEAALDLQVRVRDEMPTAVFVSAVTAHGLEPLKRALLGVVRKRKPVVELRVAVSDGRTLAELHRLGEVLEQRSEDGVMVVRARLDEATAKRLQASGIAVSG